MPAVAQVSADERRDLDQDWDITAEDISVVYFNFFLLGGHLLNCFILKTAFLITVAV